VAEAYLRLVWAQVRAQAAYRASFALDLVGNLLVLGADLLAVLVFFRITPALGGFSLPEVLLMFGLSASAFALADLAVGNIERLRFYVRTGLLDTVLIRPLGALPQLLAIDFTLRRLGRVLYALAILAVGLAAVDITWTPSRVALLIVAPICGAVLFSSIFVAGAAVAFWWIESGELANSVTYGGRDFTSYPITVYSGWFRRVFAFGIGFAFVAYYPALSLLGRSDPLGLPTAAGWASPLVAALAVGVAAAIWRIGIRQYRSTGS
jgi:ABC-2 type transport system permease protein